MAVPLMIVVVEVGVLLVVVLVAELLIELVGVVDPVFTLLEAEVAELLDAVVVLGVVVLVACEVLELI